MKYRNQPLTDKQYREILQMIWETVNASNFKPNCFDDTTVGSKSTDSNCGFCNDNYVTMETALFPDDFRKYNRQDMNHQQKHHRCPFDLRPPTTKQYTYKKSRRVLRGSEKTDYSSGCFYSCFIFGNGKYFKRMNIKEKDVLSYIRYLVDKTIKESHDNSNNK